MHSSTGASPRKRMVFTDEQKRILLEAFDNGVNSINKNQTQTIKSLADQLKCDEANWIGNERAKRKRAHDKEEHIKPPQKIRVPNCYNLFTADFYKSEEGKALSSLKEKNQRAGEKWKAMSEERKKQYIDAAKITPENVDMPTDSWGEAHRILRNMQKNAEWAEKCNIEMLYMLQHDNQVYHGGTAQGCKFLSENSDISRRFSSAVYSKESHDPAVDISDKTALRIAVQSVLNSKYALAAGDPNARVPYGSIQPSEVVGFPPSLTFKPPSHYGVCNLKLILEHANQISFIVGRQPIASTTAVRQQLTSTTPTLRQLVTSNNHQCQDNQSTVSKANHHLAPYPATTSSSV